MKHFPKDIKFKYTWRKYQQRVLDELSTHLEDKHLHVIAPPGSGKTVLGLEIALRLNNPVLILAPTLAIRNQWIDRFCSLFLQTTDIPEWISKDIYKPKFMTVAAYQGLHAACNGKILQEDYEESEEDETDTKQKTKYNNSNLENIINLLKKQGVKTIVTDEAHHLKNEWWKTLTTIKDALDPVIVGLTATPPYDTSGNEWGKYIGFNGAIDTEIGVPELIIEGDLCPHQDYIYFTLPVSDEYEKIYKFRHNTENLFKEIIDDSILIENIQTHPCWANPEENKDWIYNNLSYYIPVLSFLKTAGITIPKIHFEIIGDYKYEIPVLDYARMTSFLNFYLFKELVYFEKYKEHKDDLEGKLRRHGIIYQKQINFQSNAHLTTSLTSSISKLEGIKNIVNFEYQQLTKDLRLVILSDFIRKEYYTNSAENNITLSKLGVMSIFEKLRRDFTETLKLGVLTGSIVIIPKTAEQELIEKGKQYNVPVTFTSVPFDDNYILVSLSENNKDSVIKIITEIFENGSIQVLVGTKALLGEGWDAPAINSLILASFIGSFVSSNQMRGRAIRTHLENTGKTGNIWHLVCVDPSIISGGDDWETMKRRFKSFVGISYDQNSGIENGINRLLIPENIHNEYIIKNKNEETFSFAYNRKLLITEWQNALKKGVNLVEEIKIPFDAEGKYTKTKKLYYKKTLTYVYIQLLISVLTFSSFIFNAFFSSRKYLNNYSDFSKWACALGLFFLLVYGRELYITFKLYVKYRDISKDIHNIGKTLLLSLIQEGSINTSYSHLEVVSSMDHKGEVSCYLKGGSIFEQILFANCLQETVDMIDNPRYIIVRKNRIGLFLNQYDYHSVPQIIGKNSKLAVYFETEWQKIVGNCELIYTGNNEGRKTLLKAQTLSLSAQFGYKTEKINAWK